MSKLKRPTVDPNTGMIVYEGSSVGTGARAATDPSKAYREETLGGAFQTETASPEFLKKLNGYGLVTAEFIYGMPDSPHVLNTFLWQDYDLAPDFPRLFNFIDFWNENIEGPLQAVRFTDDKMLAPTEYRAPAAIYDIGGGPPLPGH